MTVPGQGHSVSDVVSAMWAEDSASKTLGMEVVASEVGRVELAMTVRADMVNGHGICHGGFIFSLADSAFAFACNSHNLKAVAVGARIEFLAPAKPGDRLTAISEQITQGQHSGIYDTAIRNQNNDLIALFRGNARRIGGVIVAAQKTDAVLNELSAPTKGYAL